MDREKPPSRFLLRYSSLIGRSRFIVLFAVVGVLLVSISLFVLGTIQAVTGVLGAWHSLWLGELDSRALTVEFLDIVSTMLKAVIFYIIGVGFYSLFVEPLNITVALGVETLSDLESKVISVVVVILGLTFLEHFVAWEDPVATLQFGLAAAVVVAALVLFERLARQVEARQETRHGRQQEHAQEEMFGAKQEQADVGAGAARKDGTAPAAPERD